MSRTKHARPTSRTIQIWRGDRLLSVRNAPTEKQALLDYFKDNLGTLGYRDPLVTGNVLTVTSATKQPYEYVAKEVR